LTPAAALLLADGRTPFGSYAHSAGLEAAVAAGLRADGVPAFIAARLRSVAFSEAAISAAAVRAGDDIDRLEALDAEASARQPSPPLRAAATALGRAILRTGAQLYPQARTLAAYRARSAGSPRPVAFGVVAAAGGLGPAEAALVSLHDDAACVAGAAVKLLPVDAGSASAWIAAAGAELERLARAAARPSARLPSLSAPLIELRSLAHAHDQRRLFAS